MISSEFSVVSLVDSNAEIPGSNQACSHYMYKKNFLFISRVVEQCKNNI